MNATDRVRAELQRLVREKRLRQTAVAKLMGMKPPGVNKYIQGNTPITVALLEAVAQVAKVPIAELLAEPGTIHQLNADEAALLRWLRRWPLSVTRALVTFLAFFADEAPQALQTRNLHELWRRMPAKQRDWFYSVGLLLREGTLPADLQARLLQRLEADQAAYADDPEGRRRTHGDDA